MKEVYVIGSYSTQFKRWIEKSVKDLTRMALLGVLEDAAIDGKGIQSAWFSNCGWGFGMPPKENDPGSIGQMSLRGHIALAPLVQEGLFPNSIPIYNVESACSSGSVAFNGAWKDILSDQCDLSLAIGAEKVFFPNHLDKVIENIGSGTDIAELPRLAEQYRKICEISNKEWGMKTDHTLLMDVYATLAAWHMWKWGTTREQIAAVASKNHFHGSLNPLAQYQFEVPVEKVLNDYVVSWPLTRSMCAPIGDGAAAALLCSANYLNRLPGSIQKRAVKVLASAVATGYRQTIDGPSISYWAAERAYKMAGLKPEDISLAETHDATAIAEIAITEMLGFCPMGQGGKFAESGATRFDGVKPVNTSGGLESKGHPIGATGLSQINEIVMQLRGEADKRQVKNPQIGLIENGGGVVGFDEFCCAVTILSRNKGGK